MVIRSNASKAIVSSLFSLPTLAAVLATGLVAGACDWREFDDISDTTWVDTSGAPSGVDSNDFAVALAEANNEASSETKQLAVISRSKLTLAFLSYDSAGKVTTKQSISLDSNSGGPFELLPQSPIYASDPRSGRVAVAAGGKVAIGEATRGTLEVATTPNSGKSAGLTFLTTGGKSYIAAATERGVTFIDVAAPTVTTAICTTGALTISRIVALGAVAVTGSPDERLVIWYETSNAAPAEVNAFTVAIAGNTCTLAGAAGAVDTSLSNPARADYPLIEGARIVQIPGTDAVAISDPLKGLVSIQQFGATRVVSTFAAPDVLSLDLGKIDAETYAFVGSANTDIEGKSNAGRVQATKITGVTAEATPSMTLYDASPETEQRFGRAVAAVPFDGAGSPIIVVGADNEMFTYFRTSLYAERRAR